MGANTAGIYGAQLYREDDEPRYRRAFSICIAVLSLGTLLAVIRKVDEIFIRRRNGGKIETESNRDDKELYDDLEPRHGRQAIPQPTRLSAEIKPAVVQET
jgi:hypothetical protein